MNDAARNKVIGLSCWKGAVEPAPLAGGITNVNFVVEDAGEKFVARIGGDLPLHQIMRFNELAADGLAQHLQPARQIRHRAGAPGRSLREGSPLGARFSVEF